MFSRMLLDYGVTYYASHSTITLHVNTLYTSHVSIMIVFHKNTKISVTTITNILINTYKSADQLWFDWSWLVQNGLQVLGQFQVCSPRLHFRTEAKGANMWSFTVVSGSSKWPGPAIQAQLQFQLMSYPLICY